MIRADAQDKVYRTLKEKYNAIIEDIKDDYARGQPVLVGTTSIENSELLSGFLKKQNLPHQVLNAKQHAKEAEIVAQAGRPKMITIATNMAGRGTDIVLGGNVEKQVQFVEADAALEDGEKTARIEKLRGEWQSLHEQVVNAGGLKIIGSERHESRRIDNQLRGRSGRQGDPGASRFYLSMEDPLLRIFAGDRMKAIMDRLKLPEGEAIEAGMVTRSIESAQRKVEARNFDIRKQLLEYDDVANDQRREIYRLRNEILETEDMSEMVTSLRRGYFTDMFRSFIPAESVEEQWDVNGLQAALAGDWQIELPLKQMLDQAESMSDDDLLEKVLKATDEAYDSKVAIVGREAFSGFERSIVLQTLDQSWREHLTALDALRQGIHLRGYAQKQPKQEYKREAFELFGSLLDRVRADVVRVLMNVRIQSQEEAQQAEQQIEAESERRAERARAQHADFGPAASEEPADVEALTLPDEPEAAKAQPFKRFGDKIGRNDPCPCGSGKKYKQCHGKLA
jgi:preprotein translocase subunit SecA